MSNNQLAGFPAFGPRVDTAITHNIKAVILDPEVELPTSAPASPQAQATITENDVPTMKYIWTTPGLTIPQRHVVAVFAYFRNDGASQATVYVATKTGASTYSNYRPWYVPAGQYYMYTRSGVAVSNNVQDIKAYANQAGVKLLSVHYLYSPDFSSISYPKGINNLAIDLGTASLLSGTNNDAAQTYYLLGYIGGYTHQQASISRSVYLTNGTHGLGFMYLYNAEYYNTSATDTKPHPRIFYPTRIAYTPIL